METIAIFVIIFMVGVEVYCVDWLISYFCDRSEDRTDARREEYRRIAYAEKDEIRRMSQARETLWESIARRKEN